MGLQGGSSGGEGDVVGGLSCWRAVELAQGWAALRCWWPAGSRTSAVARAWSRSPRPQMTWPRTRFSVQCRMQEVFEPGSGLRCLLAGCWTCEAGGQHAAGEEFLVGEGVFVVVVDEAAGSDLDVKEPPDAAGAEDAIWAARPILAGSLRRPSRTRRSRASSSASAAAAISAARAASRRARASEATTMARVPSARAASVAGSGAGGSRPRRCRRRWLRGPRG